MNWINKIKKFFMKEEKKKRTTKNTQAKASLRSPLITYDR